MTDGLGISVQSGEGAGVVLGQSKAVNQYNRLLEKKADREYKRKETDRNKRLRDLTDLRNLGQDTFFRDTQIISQEASDLFQRGVEMTNSGQDPYTNPEFNKAMNELLYRAERSKQDKAMFGDYEKQIAKNGMSYYTDLSGESFRSYFGNDINGRLDQDLPLLDIRAEVEPVLYGGEYNSMNDWITNMEMEVGELSQTVTSNGTIFEIDTKNGVSDSQMKSWARILVDDQLAGPEISSLYERLEPEDQDKLTEEASKNGMTPLEFIGFSLIKRKRGSEYHTFDTRNNQDEVNRRSSTRAETLEKNKSARTAKEDFINAAREALETERDAGVGKRVLQDRNILGLAGGVVPLRDRGGKKVLDEENGERLITIENIVVDGTSGNVIVEQNISGDLTRSYFPTVESFLNEFLRQDGNKAIISSGKQNIINQSNNRKQSTEQQELEATRLLEEALENDE